MKKVYYYNQHRIECNANVAQNAVTYDRVSIMYVCVCNVSAFAIKVSFELDCRVLISFLSAAFLRNHRWKQEYTQYTLLT